MELVLDGSYREKKEVKGIERERDEEDRRRERIKMTWRVFQVGRYLIIHSSFFLYLFKEFILFAFFYLTCAIICLSCDGCCRAFDTDGIMIHIVPYYVILKFA